jgi:lysophospholipase L1-like esterase
MVAGAVAACCLATGTAADAAVGAHPTAQAQSSSHWAPPGGNQYNYYLALGDSLAWGYQPGPAGTGVKSGHGYADDIAAQLRRDGDRHLKYVNLSCPDETTGTMLDGDCPGLAQSGQKYKVQQDAAVDFLKAHPHARILVTLDIGANNVDSCVTATSVDVSCIEDGLSAAQTQLPEILAGLKAAAGSHVTFAAMNYYDPFLALWLTGSSGQTLAQESVDLSADFNGILDGAFADYGVKVADVSTAFDTTDFTDTASFDGTTVPVNVAEICRLTYMCDPAPVGPDFHTTDAGYALIAKTFEPLIEEPAKHCR